MLKYVNTDFLQPWQISARYQWRQNTIHEADLHTGTHTLHISELPKSLPISLTCKYAYFCAYILFYYVFCNYQLWFWELSNFRHTWLSGLSAQSDSLACCLPSSGRFTQKHAENGRRHNSAGRITSFNKLNQEKKTHITKFFFLQTRETIFSFLSFSKAKNGNRTMDHFL